MSVYVDNPRTKYRHMKMCHMLADEHFELLGMADRVGVDWKYLQAAGTVHEHFDICLAKRQLVVAAGGKEVSNREIALIIQKRRKLASPLSMTERPKILGEGAQA